MYIFLLAPILTVVKGLVIMMVKPAAANVP
jgi:hypothetical protein